MGRQRRGRSERDAVGYLTEGRIEDLSKHLSTRDIEILKTIDKFKYINTEQLCELIPEIDGHKAFKDLVTGKTRLNKRLRILFDNHFICKDSPRLPYGEGTSKQYCWLDKGGNYIVHGDTDKKVRKSLPQDYLHYSAITDAFIFFKRLHSDKENKISVKYIRMEQPLQTISLIPDMMTVINDNGTPRLFLIEIDRGYKKEKIEVDKIMKYALWKSSYAWRQEEWAKLINNCPFPRIVYLVDDTRKYWSQRVNRIKKAISGYDIDIQFHPLSTVETLLKDS